MSEQPMITIYGTSWCPDCIRSRYFFRRHQIPFQWIDIDQDLAAEAYVLEVNRGLRRVPTILLPDGSILVEPSNEELAQRLRTEA